jgi:2',3'-cyclic-nucleotide 2'-phosphodiesterase (5'-nucleotidase family)
VLNPPISQYDILRTLPFGGGLVELEIKGDLLLQVLEASVKNKGAGGWLQYGNISYNEVTKNGSLKGQPIDPTKTYRIVTTDFLISGKETNLAFFNEKNLGVVKMYPARTTVGDIQADIRLAIIRYLEQKK